MSHAQKNVSHVAIRSAKAGLVALLSLLGSVRATVVSVTATGGIICPISCLTVTTIAPAGA